MRYKRIEVVHPSIGAELTALGEFFKGDPFVYGLAANLRMCALALELSKAVRSPLGGRKRPNSVRVSMKLDELRDSLAFAEFSPCLTTQKKSPVVPSGRLRLMIDSGVGSPASGIGLPANSQDFSSFSDSVVSPGWSTSGSGWEGRPKPNSKTGRASISSWLICRSDSVAFTVSLPLCPQSTVSGQLPGFVFDPTFQRQVIRPPVFLPSPRADDTVVP